MRLYLDTEFSDLVPEAKLISIAMVDENGDGFYAELTDTYMVEDCSDFTKENVLPYLLGSQYQMTRIECSLKLGAWIEDHNCHCVLSTDAPSWDMPFVMDLFADLWPNNLEKKHVFLTRYTADEFEEKRKELNLNQHNALHDALIMRALSK